MPAVCSLNLHSAALREAHCHQLEFVRLELDLIDNPERCFITAPWLILALRAAPLLEPSFTNALAEHLDDLLRSAV